MYRKKDKKVMVIAAAVVILFIAAIYILPNYKKIFSPAPERETEEITYEVLIHKTSAGRIDVKKSLLKSDSENETTLKASPGELISLNVTPRKNKELLSVLVADAKDFNNQYSTIINETKENTYTVDFSMPDRDVVMTFQFETLETDPPQTEKKEVKESETQKESETENGNPYNLTLHGITADLITSFNGLFDDRDFCRQLGDSLHLNSPRSEYYGVTDVTFMRDPYEGEKDSDKVYTYIYFGEDPEWRMLSTYYLKDRSYVFTKYVKPEANESETASPDGMENIQVSDSAYSYPSSGSSGVSPAPSATSTVSFDILQISKVFLDYTGDADGFYQKAFEYVLSKGYTGSITGTMSSYDIDPEKKTAEITIKLSNGKCFKARYSRESKSFSFSGL